MGAWGHGPFDSDQALDWTADAYSPLVEQIWKLVHRAESKGISWYSHEIRAAAEIFIKNELDYHAHRACEDEDGRGDGVNLADKLANLLGKMLDDKEWLESWNEPNLVAASINDQIRALTSTDTQQ
jgi:hypothetical protein